MKKKILIIGIVSILVFVYIGYLRNDPRKEKQNWPVYESRNSNLRFRYPSKEISIKDAGDKIVLDHSIPYKFPSYCGEGPSDNKIPNNSMRLTDFHLSLEFLKKDVKNAILDYAPIKEDAFNPSGSLKFFNDGGVVERVKFGSNEGFSINVGAEGCGEEMIFIPITDSKTLKISKVFDDSNYFLSITSEEKKLDIKGLIYTNNINKQQDIDRIISSIKTE